MDYTTSQAKIWRDPEFFIAFGFGAGLIPIAPGTWGTLVAIPLYLLMVHLPLTLYIIITAIGFLLGIFITGRVSKALKIHDFSGIVWDEIIGYLITMTAIPAKPLWIILGFILFRIADIWKPQPIRFIDQHVHGGLGIMLDDLLAALPCLAILQIIIYLQTKIS